MAIQEWFIPGGGWDTESVVFGYIKIRTHAALSGAMAVIEGTEFDDVYPFSNIFWGGSTARYGHPVIGFTGSYKQIEEAWNEWLWKFSQFLSRLDAIEARVNLACIIGHYHWRLEPETCYRLGKLKKDIPLIGDKWGITESPDNDFSIEPLWLEYFPTEAEGVVERWAKKESE